MSKSVKILILDVILLAAVAGLLFFTGVIDKFKQRGVIEPAPEPIEEEESAADDEADDTIAAEPQIDTSEWSLILVNPWHEIPSEYLEELETASTERGYDVEYRVKEPLETMLEDCRKQGYDPEIISAFRSRETQEYLYDRTANKNDTALPGHSEHECGLAIDIIDAASYSLGDPLVDEQEDYPAQKWLMENCQNYGFILRYPKDKEEITGIIYEPWHYRYVGIEHAKRIMESGQSLEEYLGMTDAEEDAQNDAASDAES